MKKGISLLAVAVLLLLASCSQEESSGNFSAGDPVSVSLGFGIESMNISTRSTDASTIDEDSVNNLWILQFVNGSLAKKVYLSGGVKSPAEAQLVANAEGVTSTLYLYANGGASAFATDPASETALKESFLSIATESDLFPTPGYLPMWGVLENVSVSDVMSGTSTVQFTRLLARIDVEYTVSDALSTSFVMKNIRVCGVPGKLFYVAPSDGSVFPKDVAVHATDYSAVDAKTGKLSYYVPDNRQGTGSNAAGLSTGKSGLSAATYVELVGENYGEEISYRLYPGEDDVNNYDVKRNNYYKLTLALNGIYAGDSRVRRSGCSNCYMVAPGASVKIPVKRANQSDLGVQLADLTTGWTAEVIWRDNSSMTLTLSEALKSKGVFEVSTNAGQEGNALVCIKDDSNNTLWSWHIWVTGYDPSVTNHSYNSLIWMDRNLGAQNTIKGNSGSLGYLYQWGRKDPFAGAIATAAGTTTQRPLYSDASGSSTYSVPAPIAAPTASANNLQNSVRNPSLFYFKATSPRDWYPGSNTTQNSALWGATKTVYDPCPQGWKVPANGAWPSTLTTSTSTWDATYLGRTITATSAWYPAVGWQRYDTGALNHVGAEGYYWSSTVYSTSAYDFVIYSNGMSPSSSYYRANGFGARCVQE